MVFHKKRKVAKKKISAREIARKEVKRTSFENKILTLLLVLTILSSAVLLIFLLTDFSFTGFASYIQSKAGTVTEIQVDAVSPTSYWTGIYGLVFMVPNFLTQIHNDYTFGEVVRQDLFFDCMEEDVLGGNEVYVSRAATINFDNLVAGDPADVDSYTGCSGRVDCAVNTFTDTTDFYVGSNHITNVPSFSTYRMYDGEREYFDVGLLTDGTNLVYATHVEGVETLFNISAPRDTEIVNLQMMLPTSDEGNESYYFFTDPNDICPTENVTQLLAITVEGKVMDTNGGELSGAEVSVAGYSDTSDSSGNYDLGFLGLSGTYNLFASLPGYQNYFSNITVSAGAYNIYKDIVLEDLEEGENQPISVSVSGTVTSTSGNELSDVRVYLLGERTNSSSSGSYNISTSLSQEGFYTLVFVKEGYHVHSVYLNFTQENATQTYDAVLSPISNYQYETGPYSQNKKYNENNKNNNPSSIVQQVVASGDDYWVSTKEIDREVMKNTFVKEVIGIYNAKNSPMTLNFELSPNLESFVELDKFTLDIAGEAFSDLTVTIYGTAPVGTYNGSLTVSGGLDQVIPIKVKIIDKQYPIEFLMVDVDTFGGVAQPGEDFKYKVFLQNLLRDQSYEVFLKARVKGIDDGEVYAEDSYSTEISASQSFVKSIEIPENVSDGDYVLEIQADYLNFYSISSATFEVSRPIYLYSFFGIPIWLMVAVISFLSFVGLNLFMYKLHKDKKKRYRISIDYSTLPGSDADRSVRMGFFSETKKPAYYELDKLTTHSIVSGATGMGKSISAQVIIEEALMKNIAVIVFDPTAQWSGMLRKCTDKKMLGFYPKFKMKPQDARAFKGNVRMIKDSRQKIEISKFAQPGQIQIFSMNKLSPAEIDVFVANAIKQIFRSDPKESANLKTLLVFDEVHRLLPKFGGSGKGFLQIERCCREFRKWGLGVMLISQVMNDFVGEIKANINTEFQARTLEENDLNRIKTKYGEEYLKSLVKAEIGNILFQNADYNRGRPYFVNFRPILHSTRRLSDEELEKYNKYNDQVDEFEFQLEALEKEKVDTFDYKMELKLIKDKIMSGSFSVVEIYIEGFGPRLKKEWEKLGKKPPERKIELVSEEEMAEEEKKSQAEKAKADAKAAAKPKEEEKKEGDSSKEGEEKKEGESKDEEKKEGEEKDGEEKKE